jgi:hypothetical protein
MTSDSLNKNEEIKRLAIELLASSGSRFEIPENQIVSVRALINATLGQTVRTAAKWADTPYLLLRSAKSTAIDLITKGQTLAEHPDMPVDFKDEVISQLRDALEQLDARVDKWAV